MHIKTENNFRYITFRPQVRTLIFDGQIEINKKLYSGSYPIRIPWHVFFTYITPTWYGLFGLGLTKEEFKPGMKVYHPGLLHVRGNITGTDYNYAFSVCSPGRDFTDQIKRFWESRFKLNYIHNFSGGPEGQYAQYLAKVLDDGEIPLLDETPVYFPKEETCTARVFP